MMLNRNTNCGFTLIEIIIVCGIISILSGTIFSFVYNYKWFNNGINVYYCNNSIMSLINSSKQYCRSNKSMGTIIIDINGNNIVFNEIYPQKRRINSFTLPEGFTLYSVVLSNGGTTISVDDNGNINKTGNFQYKDLKGGIHMITICVATTYVDIKKDPESLYDY